MTNKLIQRLTPVLIGTGLALGLAAPAGAEELRIGFIAPLTGIFAQVGKDMENGFQLYLDQHGGKLGGAAVKFIVEDEQGKPDTAVTKAKKLVLSDKVHLFLAGCLRRPAMRSRRSARRRRRSISPRSVRRRSHSAAARKSILTSSARAGRHCPIIRSANGPATRATRRP